MKVVMIFGTFDGIHEGHRDFFHQAKELGDFLVVVLARDRTVFEIKKHFPKYSECVRWAMLFGEGLVDEVVMGDEQDRYRVVREWKPDVICLGYDQYAFTEKLQTFFRGTIVRLKPFHPNIYKSSKKNFDPEMIFRAKEILRQKLLLRRKSIPKHTRKTLSELLTRRILDIPEVQRTSVIGIYRSIGSEVDTRILLDDFFEKKKTVVLPVFQKENMNGKFFKISPKTHYVRGDFGCSIPLKGIPFRENVSVCIVPCVGCDREGNRLGRGGGCYDRLLRSHPKMISIGLIFPEQLLPCIPVDKNDAPLKKVISS